MLRGCACSRFSSVNCSIDVARWGWLAGKSERVTMSRSGCDSTEGL